MKITESQLRQIIRESIEEMLHQDDPSFWEKMSQKASDQHLPHPQQGTTVYGNFNQGIKNPESRVNIQKGYRDKFADNSIQAMINAIGQSNRVYYQYTTTNTIHYWSENGEHISIQKDNWGKYAAWLIDNGHKQASVTEAVKMCPADQQTATVLANWVKKFHANDPVLKDYVNPNAWMGDFSFKFQR